MNQNVFWKTALAGLLAALLSACATTNETLTDDPSAENAVAEETPMEIEPWDGHGMEIPLDGSSLEAFEVSLARVKAHTTPEQYSGLEKAIDYLLLYDLGAEGDRAKLAARLDGLTPTQVMKRVGWRRPGPGRSPADKTAADAKIIDS